MNNSKQITINGLSEEEGITLTKNTKSVGFADLSGKARNYDEAVLLKNSIAAFFMGASIKKII